MDNRGSNSSGTLTADAGERSVPQVLKDIGSGIQQIIRSEIKLAKIEVTESARDARSSAVAFGGGGILGIYAVGFLLLTVMFALEIVLPNWLAALIVGVLALAGAGLGISRGRERLKAIRPPSKTLQTVKEDIEWISEQQKS